MKKEQIALLSGYRVDEQGVIYHHNVRLSPTVGPNGYYALGIAHGEKGHRRTVRCGVHRLQAFQKYGDNLYEPGIVVRHLNGNPLDNSFDNIAIGTLSENRLDIPAEIRKRAAVNASAKCHQRYPKEIVLAVQEDRRKGFSYRKLMNKYKITSKGTISYMCNHNYETFQLDPKVPQ